MYVGNAIRYQQHGEVPRHLQGKEGAFLQRAVPGRLALPAAHRAAQLTLSASEKLKEGEKKARERERQSASAQPTDRDEKLLATLQHRDGPAVVERHGVMETRANSAVGMGRSLLGALQGCAGGSPARCTAPRAASSTLHTHTSICEHKLGMDHSTALGRLLNAAQRRLTFLLCPKVDSQRFTRPLRHSNKLVFSIFSHTRKPKSIL